MLVRTECGLIPIVRQFRPSVEEFTWELPAGTVDAGETPEDAAAVVEEETGLSAGNCSTLGTSIQYRADSSRCSCILYHDTFSSAAGGL